MAERWLTYQQLGDALGMTASAARQRALRFGWRKMPGNDGKILVLLPEGVSVQPRTRSPAKSPTQTPKQTPPNEDAASTLAEVIAAFQKVEDQMRVERDAARAEAAIERARAEAALVRAASAEGQLQGLREAAARNAQQLEQAQAKQQPRQHDLFGGSIGRVLRTITGRKPRD
jgi:hypothetical protein